MILNCFSAEIDDKEVTEQNWAICSYDGETILEIYLKDCTLSKKIDGESTNDSIANEFMLPKKTA